MTAAPHDAPTQPRSPVLPSERDLRFNFRILLIHGMLGQTGFRLLSAPTFLPAYISLLAGNNAAVGIASAINSMGMALSPYLGAWMVEHRQRAKRLGILFGGAMRLQVLLLALVALFVPREWAIAAVWVVIGLWGFASGLQGVIFNFIISKCIPAHRRGRLLGLRNASAGLTLFVVSWIGGRLIDRYAFPHGYGLTFLLAFVLTFLGLVAFVFLREPDTIERRVRMPLLARLADLPSFLASEPNFLRYVLARILATAGRAALPFYILYVGERFGFSGARLAFLTILFVAAQSQAALLWGLLSDRSGFRQVFLGGVGLWMAGNLLSLLGNGLWSAYGIFFLVGAGSAGFMLASQNLVLEFGNQENRPMRIASANASSEFVGMMAYLSAGMLSDAASLAWIFGLSLALQAAAIIAMMKVEDPRVAVENN